MDTNLDYDLYVTYDDKINLKIKKAKPFITRILSPFKNRCRIWLDDNDNLLEEKH